MQLSPEDIATAEACGVTFLPATPAQVERLAMQRKIFYAAGQPVLATRGSGFFETAGTLQRVIEEGLQQQRDLAAWQGDAAGAAAPKVEPARIAETPAPVETARPEAEAAEHLLALSQGMPPKRTRRRWRPAAVAVPWQVEEAPVVEPVPPPAAVAERPAATPPVRRARQPGQRWRVAGATRRGRAEKHWSQRQR